MPTASGIRIKKAYQHNLQDIDVWIPHDRLTVITGPSGSGKTSLAHYVLFREGQRLYAESLSTYLRQFLGSVMKPHVKQIEGLSPTVTIRQQHRITETNRSTVGTATDTYHYLAALYAVVGEVVSPHTGQVLTPATPALVLDAAKRSAGEEVVIGYPLDAELLMKHAGAYLQSLFEQGVRYLWQQGRLIELEPFVEFVAGMASVGDIWGREDWSEAVVVKGVFSPSDEAPLYEAAQAVLDETGRCVMMIRRGDEWQRLTFHTRLYDGTQEYLAPSEDLFNFNNSYGACPACEGFGLVMRLSEEKIIPDPSLSVRQGAVACWKGERAGELLAQFIERAPRYGFRLDVAYQDLTPEEKALLWKGRDGLMGIEGFFAMLDGKTYKPHVRMFKERFIERLPCPTCEGYRLCPEALAVKVGGKHIGELARMEAADLLDFLENLRLSEHQQQRARIPLEEVLHRLRMMKQLGLGYITLERTMRTLSGGEWQRVQLLKAVRNAMSGITYILDEPTVGLHPTDTARLIAALRELARENTVVVVEHDAEVIRSADYVVELGPGAGQYGGQVVFEGPADDFAKAQTLTADYIHGRRRVEGRRPEALPSQTSEWIRWQGVQKHNLKGVDVTVPLGRMSVIVGPSGAGKSTLMQEVMYPSLAGVLSASTAYAAMEIEQPPAWVDLVDQKSISRSSRSNVMSYIGLYPLIRAVFGQQKEALRMGLTAAHFSFNSKKGHCESCKGEGVVYIDLQFMAPVEMVCPECGGKRFKPSVLEVKVGGKTIADMFDMEVSTARTFFSEAEEMAPYFDVLERVGLGYLHLGQTTAQLSGGELHRLKIARHLLERSEEPGIIFFDEPTTGLHLHDIATLLKALDELVAQGHTVVIIEHHPDVIRSADWVIELGPGGGKSGGRLLFSGPPQQFVQTDSPLVPFIRQR